MDIEHIEILGIKEDDILIVTLDENATDEEVHSVSARLRALIDAHGKKADAIVTRANISFRVLRREVFDLEKDSP
jgi:hypothetical protein